MQFITRRTGKKSEKFSLVNDKFKLSSFISSKLTSFHVDFATVGLLLVTKYSWECFNLPGLQWKWLKRVGCVGLFFLSENKNLVFSTGRRVILLYVNKIRYNIHPIPPKPLGTIVPRCTKSFKEALNIGPMMPRGASLYYSTPARWRIFSLNIVHTVLVASFRI